MTLGSASTGQPDIDDRAVRRNLGWLLGAFGGIVVIAAVTGLLVARLAHPSHSTTAHRHSAGSLVAALIIPAVMLAAGRWPCGWWLAGQPGGQ